MPLGAARSNSADGQLLESSQNTDRIIVPIPNCSMMVIMKLTTMFLFLFLSAPLSIAESPKELIDRAFGLIEDNPRARWSFTRTDYDGEITSIGHYDPRLAVAKQWNLVSIDGRIPSADEIERYRKERASEGEDDSGGNDQYRSLMKEGSATLIHETDEFWLFAFEPVGDSPEEAEFMASVDGTLKITKNDEYVASIMLQNNKAIKPGSGVKIQNFFTLMEFEPSQPGGRVLLAGIQVVVEGRAMGVIKFDELETVTWSCYEQVLD